MRLQCLRSASARSLHESVDGCGLALASQVPQQHRWLETPDSALTGAVYIGAIKVRGNLMNVPLNCEQQEGVRTQILPVMHAEGLDRWGTSYIHVQERMLPAWHDTTKSSSLQHLMLARRAGMSWLSQSFQLRLVYVDRI